MRLARSRAPACARKSRQIPGRVNARAVVGEHPAEEAAARRLAFERRLLQHHCRLTEHMPSLRFILAQALHARSAVRKVQPAGLRVVSVGRGGCRGPRDEGVRIDARVVQCLAGGAVLTLEKGDVPPHARVDHPGVATARPLPNRGTLDDDGVFAVRRHPSSGCKTGESRSDDDHIGSRGERGLGRRRERRVVPPEGRFAIVLGEWRGTGARRTGGTPEAHNLLNSDKFDRVGQRTCCLHPVVSRSVSTWTTSASAR
jgi:hypothetical protein